MQIDFKKLVQIFEKNFAVFLRQQMFFYFNIFHLYRISIQNFCLLQGRVLVKFFLNTFPVSFLQIQKNEKLKSLDWKFYRNAYFLWIV